MGLGSREIYSLKKIKGVNLYATLLRGQVALIKKITEMRGYILKDCLAFWIYEV